MASYNLIVDDVSLVNFAFSPKFSTAIESKQIVEQKPKQIEFIAQKATQEVQPEINPIKGQESQTSNSWSLGIFLGILLLILFFIFRGSGNSYRSSRGSGDGGYNTYTGGDGGGGGGGGGDGCGGGDGGGGGCGD
ncbi:MAG: hypothetical protein KME55_25735 [Nostoc indistinguendum CM1-VF10]|jgi:hypothetical protein|nr:hypothetical protein [Nostoc indistinguendum CM1-VF10]